MSEHDLNLILARDHTGRCHRLWACRGEGKGCERNKYRNSKAPCSDCIGPLDERLTVQEVLHMIKQGDA